MVVNKKNGFISFAITRYTLHCVAISPKTIPNFISPFILHCYHYQRCLVVTRKNDFIWKIYVAKCNKTKVQRSSNQTYLWDKTLLSIQVFSTAGIPPIKPSKSFSDLSHLTNGGTSNPDCTK